MHLPRIACVFWRMGTSSESGIGVRHIVYAVLLSVILWGAEAQAHHESLPQKRTGLHPIIGLNLGERIPDFRAVDQYGTLQDFSSIRGPKGAVIYFHRSAAWCIYCKLQLVQLQELQDTWRKNGLGVCAISYDSPEILQDFARQQQLSFPLLSDPQSKIIRDFNLLDATVLPGSPAYGVPYHGSYVVNEAGVVVAKFFEQTFAHSSGIVLTRLFGSPLNTHEKLVKHEHLDLKYYASAHAVTAGERITLTIDFFLHDKVHVYAPGAKNFLVIDWDLDSTAAVAIEPVAYPPPQLKPLPSTAETVPVYRGNFRLTRDIIFTTDQRAIHRATDPEGNVVVQGTLRFQACDETTCYLPRKVPLAWQLATRPQ
jgi:peroxiredoxin